MREVSHGLKPEDRPPTRGTIPRSSGKFSGYTPLLIQQRASLAYGEGADGPHSSIQVTVDVYTRRGYRGAIDGLLVPAFGPLRLDLGQCSTPRNWKRCQRFWSRREDRTSDLLITNQRPKPSVRRY